MRLLMLPRYDELGASSRLRMLQYVPALQRAGLEVAVAPLLTDGYVADLYAGNVSARKVLRAYGRRLRQLRGARGFDVLWVEKELLPWLPHWLEQLPVPGAARVVVDYDDAVFHRYDQHRSGIVRGVLGHKIDAVMRQADLVTAGNDYLAQRARSADCKRVEWLPTVIDLERYRPRSSTAKVAADVVTVGWIGSPATADYLRPLVPALEALAQHHPIRCIAVGARPDQVQGTPFLAEPWREDGEVDSLQRLDIGIMPLPDAPWERGKCGYKLIQYMACGLPVVASPVGVNTTLVQPGVNGELATSTQQWAEALKRLIVDPALRERWGAAGRQQVEQVYSLQAQAPRLIAMLGDVAVGGGADGC